MSGAQNHLTVAAYPLLDLGQQVAQYGAGLAQLGEQMPGKTQGIHDLQIVLAGLGIHHTHSGGVGVLPGLHAGELIH